MVVMSGYYWLSIVMGDYGYRLLHVVMYRYL